MLKDLLLEIGTEEIPARFIPGILNQLENLAKTCLNDANINCGQVKAFGTPRRLALVVREVAQMQNDRESENKGPSVKIAFSENGEPTKAAAGFARGQGIDVSELVVKDGYVYAVVREKGTSVSALLPELLTGLVSSLNFPKSMRWGDLDIRFVRPIRWLLALYGQEVVEFEIAGISSGEITYGHRFLSDGEIVVDSAEDYFSKLADNYVMVDQNIRKQIIRQQIEQLAVEQGGTAEIDEDLLEEVVYLVEYPTALCGRFEDKYLALPSQAVITPMREHQRYFPVFSAAGELLPVFITVRNGGAEHIDIVRHGNERVLKARLADAQFFFEEDKKIPLPVRVNRLKTVVFQEGLGSLYDKTVRLEQLGVYIARQAGVDEQYYPLIERAAYLSKADLVTGMVNEFTELQGIMGREYAIIGGEDREVAEAIFEHYLPKFAGDVLPQNTAGRMVSIADKLDNIVATFSRGLIPTGSQDPYALRRQALGIINMILDAKYHLSADSMIVCAMGLLGIDDADRCDRLLSDIRDFIRLRIKNMLLEEQIRYDIVDSVLAAGTDDIYDCWLRAKAMALYNGTELMQKAVQAFTRVGNLAKNASSSTIDVSLFKHDAEQRLYDEYCKITDLIENMIAKKNYIAVFETLAAMAQPIDEFFNSVMVMDKDDAVKNNRLALLKKIIDLTANITDLSKITA